MLMKATLEETLRSLEALTASLVEDVRTAPEHEALSPEIRLRKEALLTTRVLVSKLHMVRTLCWPPE